MKTQRLAYILLCLGLGTTFGGCVHMELIPRSLTEPCPPPTASETDARVLLGHPRIAPNIFVTHERILDTERYRSFFLTFPSSAANGQKGNLVRARYFQNKTPGAKRLIIVFPIYGGDTYPPEMFSLELTKFRSTNDTNVLWIHGHDDLLDYPAIASAADEAAVQKVAENMAERIQTAVMDTRILLDWAEHQPEVNQTRIGVVGFSLGAVIASLVMGSDDRIRAGVFMLGGANLEEIISRSDAYFLKGPVDALRARLGWKPEELQKKIAPFLKDVNPIRHGARTPDDASHVLIVEATKDQYIPPQSRSDFWRAWGCPDRIVIPATHKVAFLTMTFLNGNKMERAIVNFLDRTL